MVNKDIFIKAIQENERLIYKVASFYTDNTQDRDDLVQDIIYNLWKSFEGFKQHSALSTWMYRVAMNVSVFYLKKNKKKVPHSLISEEMLNLPDGESNGAEEKLQILHELIKDLNLLDKGILMLYLENKSHEEISRIIGISKSNVGTKLSRIKEKFKQKISKQY